MAESKRTLHQAALDRDIDARLLPPGKYRDALNVNIGESEGGDVGAVENLKGNSLVNGQATISGTTIGVIKDPNEDRVYWINTGTVNTIYEYDQSSNTVTPILSDVATRTAPLPTCAPETRATITEPDGNPPTRPAFNPLPDPPVAYCGNSNATNNGQRADNSAANTAYDYVDNSLCTFAPSFVCDMDTFTCNEVSDGSGVSQSACQSSCVDPNPPVSSPRRAVVTGCPSGAQTVGDTVTLTVTTSNFTGGTDVTVTVTGYSGPDIVITGGNGSATFDVTSATSGTVVYTPSASTSGQSSVQNSSCSIGWGVAPPAASFNCDGAGTGSCSDPGDGSGSFSSQATCEADASCAPAPPATLTCSTIRYENPAGNNPAVFAFFMCNNTCNFTFRNIAAGTSGRACVQPTFTTECSGQSTTQSIGGGVNVTTQGGFSFTDTLGGITGIPGATTTSTGLSCSSDADNP